MTRQSGRRAQEKRAARSLTPGSVTRGGQLLLTALCPARKSMLSKHERWAECSGPVSTRRWLNSFKYYRERS